MSERVIFSCQPNNTQKAISSVYAELLSSNDKLNCRPAYQRNPVWNNEQKSYLIDTIMTNCPMPIFLLYMYDIDEEYECIDGQNRLNTIKEYIEQVPEEGKTLFAWIIDKGDGEGEGEEYVYYSCDKTRDRMQIYCDEENKKKKSRNKNNPKHHRLMDKNEVKRFDKYELTLSQIKSKLDFTQRKQIFMRWQNGTSISQCDSFKNEEYPYCEYAIHNSLSGEGGLADTVGGFLKCGRTNWLWDIYRLLNAFEKEELKDIILSSIQTKVAIEKESDIPHTKYRELQSKLEKLLGKITALKAFKKSMYMSFILGYIYLWRKAPQNVRNVAEKDVFLVDFAKDSLSNDAHEHSTLNNGPQTRGFIDAFPKFRECFYAYIDKHTPISTDVIVKKKGKDTIPSSLKTDVWNTYIGKEKGGGECYCCRKKCITQREFHAGHVIPERDGGETTLENIRPICSPCNGSMGTQNMNNFINKYYPRKE